MHRSQALPALTRLLALTLLILAAAGPALGQERSKGQLLYVPCYSHIYHGVKTRAIGLTITLSVRNTDPAGTVTVTGVDYHDTSGKLVKAHLDKPMRLEPLMTAEFIVPESDSTGGSGANFMVTWKSDAPVDPVLVEAVMIGTSGQQGISFTSRGVAVKQ